MKAKPQKNKSNISTAELDALISLRKNKNIVIFEADKGGAVVIMNKSDYINEAKNISIQSMLMETGFIRNSLMTAQKNSYVK